LFHGTYFLQIYEKHSIPSQTHSSQELKKAATVRGFHLALLLREDYGLCSGNIPVKFIGVGEGINDLQVFDARAFVDTLFW
jgi:hypothetical protein